jgi:hypothetical protein
MPITDERRRQLAAIVEDLSQSKIPIDNPRIERALIAIIETLLEGEESVVHARADAV